MPSAIDILDNAQYRMCPKSCSWGAGGKGGKTPIGCETDGNDANAGVEQTRLPAEVLTALLVINKLVKEEFAAIPDDRRLKRLKIMCFERACRPR